ELPLGWFSRRTIGDTRKLFTEDVERVELFVAHHIPDIVRGVTVPLAILALLFYADWRLALVSMIPLTIAPLFLVRMYRGYDKDMARYYELLAKMNGTIIEYIRGMSVVRAFNRTASSFGDYRDSVSTYFAFWKRWTLRIIDEYGGFFTSLESGAFFILAAGGPLYLSGLIGLPAFLIALILGPAYVASVKPLYFMVNLMSMNLQGVTRIRAVLEEPILSEPAAPVLPAENRVLFSRVAFAYDEQNAVSDLSFEAPPGTITALVGPSGAGKTTAALLAARFYDPASGRLSLDGVPYPAIGTKELMRRVTICFQESQLFKGTIEENIRMGNRGASFAEVERAARAARAHEFIATLPEGYATRISGDRALSGGQIQRIAIARAILKGSPVVLLDEATSYADPENERLIQEALGELLRDRSVIVVAHRLRTLRHVDRILVFDGGRIVEKGGFDELVSAGGLFSRLWKSALSSVEWKVGGGAAAEVKGEAR
ncbi:MAG TPA: ABC transporter ATP-binding protein, partial [Spirochaetia bacterium]